MATCVVIVVTILYTSNDRNNHHGLMDHFILFLLLMNCHCVVNIYDFVWITSLGATQLWKFYTLL